VYISLEAHLAGEAAVNLYYTIVSLYGWYLWNKKKKDTRQPVLHISYLNKKELTITLIFFASLYLLLYLSLTYIKNAFWDGAIPWADALASSAAFVSMYLMAKKKVESWIGWIITNVVSAPLYFVKDLSLTSVYYVILLILAILGFLEWQKKANAVKQHV
jgi:nicotinamide mononucleotide transporter